MTKHLKSAARAVRDTLAEVQRTEAALAGVAAPATLAADLPEATALQAARAAFEDARASVAVGDAPPDAVAAAERALRQAEATHATALAAHQQVEALAAGLRRRLARAQDAAAAAAAAFEAATVAWCRAQYDEADSQYTESGQAAAAAAVRLQALHAYLADRGVRVRPAMRWPELNLPPLGTVSLQAAIEARPELAQAGAAWVDGQLFARIDSTALDAALQAEINAAAGMDDAAGAARPGVAATIARAMRRVTAG